MKIVNPIIPGFHPDPSLCRVGRDYYLATSSFEYFPGVPLFHSRDLVHWRPIGHALTRASQLQLHHTASSLGIWAPTLRHHQGRFYLVTTDVFGGRGHLIVTAADPAGPWSDPVSLSSDGDNGFDPDLFFDDDGSVWFSWKGFPEPGIFSKPIDPVTGRDLGPRHLIWKGFEDIQCEAPHLYKHDGRYYLLVAEGGTFGGHMVVAARAEAVTGPYESCPHNPILTHRANVFAPLQCTGHGDLVQAHDGSWWIVFLAVRKQVTRECFATYHVLGRETALAPVTWSREGWPVVAGGKPLTLETEVACGIQPQPWDPEPARDDFDSATLRHTWCYRRNPPATGVSLVERPGFLTLRGQASTLDDKAPLAFLCRRQQHFDFVARTHMDFAPGADSEEAGLAIQMNERHHYEIAVRGGGPREVFVRQRIGSLSRTVACCPLPPGPVILQVSGDAVEYVFAFEAEGHALRELARGDARYLATEVAGGFTGVFMGPYATGNGTASSAPAYFDWFSYYPQPRHGCT